MTAAYASQDHKENKRHQVTKQIKTIQFIIPLFQWYSPVYTVTQFIVGS